MIIKEILMQALTIETINRLADVYSKQPGIYWLVNAPARTVKLSNGLDYANPDAQGFDHFVFWPDYKVAGTIRNIVNKFRNAGINDVHVGTLYNMTNGNAGCYRRVVPLSEEVVAACSIDPLYQVIPGETVQESVRIHQLQQRQQPYSQVTNQLVNVEPAGRFPGGVYYQQQAEERNLPYQQQSRQQIGEELSYLPVNIKPGFPGGQEFWNQTNQFFM
jgi:hypothetical protein